MNTHVTQMVELLFQNVQTSEEVQALHDEVMNNCQERYQDLISHGISEEEATAAVMESLKGMDEVLREYPQREKTPEANTDEAMDPEIADAAEERMTFSPEEIRELDIQVTGCDIRVIESSDNMVSIEKHGDVRMEMKDGKLSFRQESVVTNLFRDISWEGNPFESFESFGESIRKLVQNVTDGIRNTVSSQASVTLRLPRDMRPETAIRTTGGDIQWEQVLPGQRFSFQTTSGNVELNAETEDILPALEVATVSGDISCRVNVAEVRLKTISGDIEWYGDAGSLQISTTSGEAEASGSITLTRMNSVSGDLTLTLDDGRKAEVEISSTSGDAEIRVPEDTEEVRVRLESVSGDLRLRGVQAADNAPIRIQGKTVSGDLTVCR